MQELVQESAAHSGVGDKVGNVSLSYFARGGGANNVRGIRSFESVV